MASIQCKLTKTGTPVFCACYVWVNNKQIDLTNSAARPVPLNDGDYELQWEVKGEIGEGVAIKVWANGALVAELPEQLIRTSRIGSGSNRNAPGYNPLRFTVGGAA